MDNQIEEVKQKTDIVALISERVALKKAGSNYKGLCPFHNEKSPSFMVSPELQIYKCFGCGRSGDVLTFLEEYEGMEFYEALKTLALKAGVKLKSSGIGKKNIKEQFYEINSIVASFYRYMLLKHPMGKKALDYVTQVRGITPESIDRFGLGYSPDVALALNNYVIQKKKVTLKELEQAGIVYSGSGRSFDRFRGRLIFFLYDHRNNVVGFAGRLLPGVDKDLAKYINTPETPVYKKSQILYGLNVTKGYIKKLGVAVVVEGEIDLISCYQQGIRNVVAIKGSALTEEQVSLIGRFAKTVVLALDSDFAGNEAAKRGIFIAEKAGLDVKVAEIKGFKDPDEAARKDPEALKKFIDEAVGIWDFLIDFTFSKYKSLGGDEKSKIGRELVPLLSQIDNRITQSHYLSLFASKLHVPLEAVYEEVKKQKKDSKDKVVVNLVRQPETKHNRREVLEERFLRLAFQSDPGALTDNKNQKLLRSLFARRISEELANYGTDVKISEFAKKIPPELKERFSEIMLSGSDEDYDESKLKKELEIVAREIKILDTKERLTSVAENITLFEESGQKGKLKKAENEFARLSKQLAGLNESLIKV